MGFLASIITSCVYLGFSTYILGVYGKYLTRSSTKRRSTYGPRNILLSSLSTYDLDLLVITNFERGLDFLDLVMNSRLYTIKIRIVLYGFGKVLALDLGDFRLFVTSSLRLIRFFP